MIEYLDEVDIACLRDQFAAAALTGNLAAFPETYDGDAARWAYDMAEIMLAERAKRMEAKP